MVINYNRPYATDTVDFGTTTPWKTTKKSIFFGFEVVFSGQIFLNNHSIVLSKPIGEQFVQAKKNEIEKVRGYTPQQW